MDILEQKNHSILRLTLICNKIFIVLEEFRQNLNDFQKSCKCNDWFKHRLNFNKLDLNYKTVVEEYMSQMDEVLALTSGNNLVNNLKMRRDSVYNSTHSSKSCVNESAVETQSQEVLMSEEITESNERSLTVDLPINGETTSKASQTPDFMDEEVIRKESEDDSTHSKSTDEESIEMMNESEEPQLLTTEEITESNESSITVLLPVISFGLDKGVGGGPPEVRTSVQMCPQVINFSTKDKTIDEIKTNSYITQTTSKIADNSLKRKVSEKTIPSKDTIVCKSGLSQIEQNVHKILAEYRTQVSNQASYIGSGHNIMMGAVKPFCPTVGTKGEMSSHRLPLKKRKDCEVISITSSTSSLNELTLESAPQLLIPDHIIDESLRDELPVSANRSHSVIQSTTGCYRKILPKNTSEEAVPMSANNPVLIHLLNHKVVNPLQKSTESENDSITHSSKSSHNESTVEIRNRLQESVKESKNERSYSSEFKVQVLDWYHQNGKCMARTCKHWNLKYNTLYDWIAIEDILRKQLKQRYDPKKLKKDLRCKYEDCLYFAFHIKHMKLHVRNVHSIFKCTKCEFQCSGSYQFKLHVRSTHPPLSRNSMRGIISASLQTNTKSIVKQNLIEDNITDNTNDSNFGKDLSKSLTDINGCENSETSKISGEPQEVVVIEDYRADHSSISSVEECIVNKSGSQEEIFESNENSDIPQTVLELITDLRWSFNGYEEYGTTYSSESLSNSVTQFESQPKKQLFESNECPNTDKMALHLNIEQNNDFEDNKTYSKSSHTDSSHPTTSAQKVYSKSKEMELKKCFNLKKHKLMYSEEKPLKCDIPDCDHHFEGNRDLVEHIKRVHLKGLKVHVIRMPKEMISNR